MGQVWQRAGERSFVIYQVELKSTTYTLICMADFQSTFIIYQPKCVVTTNYMNQTN